MHTGEAADFHFTDGGAEGKVIERMTLARAAGADVLLSLHADALDEFRTRGASVYTLTEEALEDARRLYPAPPNREMLSGRLILSGREQTIVDTHADAGYDQKTAHVGQWRRMMGAPLMREGAVVVPEEALVPQGGRQFVYKIVDGPDGQKTAQQVEAQIGLRLPGRVELLGGVAAGDRASTPMRPSSARWSSRRCST